MKELINQLGWIDLSSLIMVLVFFVMGLFRGLVWQLSRLLTLVLGFIVAGIWAKDLENLLVQTWPSWKPFALYISYFVIFFAVFLVLSALAWLCSNLIKKLKLSAYERVGGGFLGIATGSALVILVLTLMYAFLGPETKIIKATESSRTKPAAVKILRFFSNKLECSFLDPVLHTLDKGTPTVAEASGKKESKKKEEGKKGK